jgi:hypothetical protein
VAWLAASLVPVDERNSINSEEKSAAPGKPAVSDDAAAMHQAMPERNSET